MGLEDVEPLSSHVVHSGGSLRLIEPADPGFHGDMLQDMLQDGGGPGVNALGMRHLSHDTRQILLGRGAAFGRSNSRPGFQVRPIPPRPALRSTAGCS